MAFEFFRKIRVIVRGIQAFFAFGYLLNPVRHKMFFFQNMSHRLCRWLVPFFLVLLFFSSGLSQNILLKIIFWGQIVFYFLALFAALINLINRKKPLSFFFLTTPLYFTAMNLAALISWMVLFKKFDIWKRTERDN